MSALAFVLAAQLSMHAAIPPLHNQPAQGAYGRGLAYFGGFSYVNAGVPVAPDTQPPLEIPPPARAFVEPEFAAPPSPPAPVASIPPLHLRATEAKILYLRPVRARRPLHIVYGAG